MAAHRHHPAPAAADPQGLVSCLYRLQDKLPDDVALVPGGDERALARHHTRLLRPDDVIVYDRGYVSRACHWSTLDTVSLLRSFDSHADRHATIQC